MTAHVFSDDAGKLRFVGDFQALYSAEKDPWFQSAESGAMADYYDHSRRLLGEALRRHVSGPGLEVGCGHGFATTLIQRYVCRPMTGMDIAPAAIEKARELHPKQTFVVGNIIGEDFSPPGKFAFAVWGQAIWYLLHQIDRAIENTLRCVEPGGIFAVSQAFLAEQRYGTEILDGFNGALSLFHDRYRDRLQFLEGRYDDTERYIHRDGLLVFRVL